MKPQRALETTPEEARAIAKEACIYGVPLVDNYRIHYSHFIDKASPHYKGPWNQILHTANNPANRAEGDCNGDILYSIVGGDLRAEPLVLAYPNVQNGRYFSSQFIDAYAFNFAYVGSRTTGNNGGVYLLAGPGWTGKKPEGVDGVFQSETQFVLLLYRTQLFNPEDMENAKRVQAGYKVQTLSQFLGKPVPAVAAKLNFPKPISVEDEFSSLALFNLLNFILRFCPTHPSEKDLMARLAKIGVGAGKTFEPSDFLPDKRKALTEGMADAFEAVRDFQEKELATGRIESECLFGMREFLKNNYLYRVSGAVLGICGNSREEALCPLYFVDSTGKQLDASKHRYALRFEPGQLPPAHAFWSLTLYELPSGLLSPNLLNRYLINSSMSANLEPDGDGGLTLLIQHEPVYGDKESNWLPAPNGRFFCALSVYWPKQEALQGIWKAPPLKRSG